MFFKIIGWISIILSVLSLAPSIAPGAMSLIGFLISMVALVMSIISINTGSTFYFKSSIFVVCIGIFVVNDGLRLYGSLPQVIWQYKITAYCIFILVCIFGVFFSKRHSKSIKN